MSHHLLAFCLITTSHKPRGALQ